MGLKVEINFSNLPKTIITTLREAAQEIGLNRVAIVGGAIRDCLLADHIPKPLPLPKDLDLIVEGSAIALAEMMKKKLGSRRVSISRDNRSFQTVEIVVDGLSIDIAGAREERYSSPAENPEVIATTIKKDLKRRDFTINAIALDLDTNELIDLHGGLDSLNKRQLQFIHSNSVKEDPTRIIRGARYAARLNFNLSDQSIHQVSSTIKQWPWEWKPTDYEHLAPPALATRLRMELELLLEEEPWEEAFIFLQDWGGFLLLDDNLQRDKTWKKRIETALAFGLTPLTSFIAGTSNRFSISKRLQIPRKQQKLLQELDELQKFFTEIYSSQEYIKWKPSDWCTAIEDHNWQLDTISLAIALEIPLWESLLKWRKAWRLVEPPISARMLIEKGWQPGPLLREELKRLRQEKLDENI